MMSESTYKTFQRFNKEQNIDIHNAMESYEVFDELDKTDYVCGYIAKNEVKAHEVKLNEEKIINLEDTYYLCVR